MEVKKDITPEEALQLTLPTPTFYGPIVDREYGIKFGAFRMRDIDSGIVLFDIEADDRDEIADDTGLADDDKIIKYHFGPDFL